MKKAILTSLITMLVVFSALTFIPQEAHAETTPQWTQKKIVLVWDGIYDNATVQATSSYRNTLNYVYYWLQEKGIPFEKIYAKDITWDMVNDTQNYSYFIIPLMQDQTLVPVYNNLSASHLLTSENRYAIITYAWWTSESNLPDGEPDDHYRFVFPYEYVTPFGKVQFTHPAMASPLLYPEKTKIYAGDGNGNAIVYEYRGNVFSHTNYYEEQIDIALNLLFTIKLHYALFATPVVVGIDDITDEKDWYMMNDGTKQTLTYSNLNNLSKILRKCGFKAALIDITDNTSLDGAVVKALNANKDVLFISLHQTNASYDFGHSYSYDTIATRYTAAYNKIQNMKLDSTVIKDFTTWVLPAGQYNDNTSHFAEEHNIRYFQIEHWGISSWSSVWWNMSAVKRANKNGNELPWEDTSYDVYVVPRSYTMPFASAVSNESQVEKWWQDGYGTTHDLDYSIKGYLSKADDLPLLRGDLYFHAYSFTNDEIAQQYLDAIGNYLKAKGTAYIGTTLTEHNDFAFARQTSSVQFYYASGKVRITIQNNGPYTFPYYVAIPKSLLGSLSSTERYAVTQTRAASASIVKTDDNYVYVKITVPSLSSADFYVYILDTVQQSLNYGVALFNTALGLFITVAIIMMLFGVLTNASQKLQRTFKFD